LHLTVHFCRSVAAVEVCEVAGSITTDDDGVDIAVDLTLTFTNGVVGRVKSAYGGQRGIYGAAVDSRGSAELDCFVVPYANGNERPFRLCTADGERREAPGADTSTYLCQLIAFHDAVAGGRPMLTPGTDPINNMVALDQCRTVAARGG
jgi:predicted dehydrogenase